MTSPDAALVSIDHVGQDYVDGKTTRTVLDGVSFDVAPGEFVCIVGPSGVGKTTMLRCIAGLQQPTRGSVRIRGHQLNGPSPDVGLVFQNYDRSLMPWLNVRENVELPLRGRLDRRNRESRARDALIEVGLEQHLDKKPWQLSGGMQQRVAIARALAFGAPLLLMDEPFASVDAQTRADLEDLTLRVQKDTGQAIIVITHDIDEAIYLANRVIVLGGKPASVRTEIRVDLDANRNQVDTKSQPRFGELRSQIHALIRSASHSTSAAEQPMPQVES
ncbi:ABC transporter ATP-binding protein [Rhodococcus sp. USK10]|uniref:ABC transporter ATP-binding protein n=1 Tax=Rhodococcus sp. USK10 TaxID=2789739 RepID=UPI001C5F88DA|nr:ABC transporter ATP-binding protein [Rhodococcus sp. USK10]QYB04240.1 ABC transporter ATP-binding protein [Rhodococcus sp. USK10]